MSADRSPVRPYLLTRGRTAGADSRVAVDSTLRTAPGTAAHPPAHTDAAAGLELARLLEVCTTPTVVAEAAARTGLPVGVVRVLAADLVARGHLTLADVGEGDDRDLLERLLAGLEDAL